MKKSIVLILSTEYCWPPCAN